MANEIDVSLLLVNALIPNSELKADELDKMWSDFGRTIHRNMMNKNLVKVLNKACLSAKSHLELTVMVRTYLLTGVVP